MVVTDNGPGIDPSHFRTLLNFTEKPTRTQRTRDDLIDYDCSEHGIGFRLNAMRLANTCLVISKFRGKGQIGIQYLSVGLITKKGKLEIGNEPAISLVVVYQIKNNETFIPVTKFPEDVANHITKRSHSLFPTELDLKRYALNEMDRHSGTRIFLFELKSSESVPELVFDKSDIKVGLKWQEQHLVNHKELGSLAKYLRVMYIAWPRFTKISINDVPVDQLENPFNQAPLDSYVNTQTGDFALKTTKAPLIGDFSGVFVYKINRLVRVIKVMSNVQIGKRTFREANESLSGIATVFRNTDLTMAKCDFTDKAIVRQIKRMVQ